jgi:superfamily II DNA helicase RecQ
MRTRLLTLRYSESLGGFDDTPLLEFTRDKELTSFREYFFLVNDVPHLTCVLSYPEAVVPADILEQSRQSQESPSSSRGASRRSAADLTASLKEADRALFNTLREWRAKEAREQGIPAYLIFNNRQLLDIVTLRPESPNALLQIFRVGPAKRRQR